MSQTTPSAPVQETVPDTEDTIVEQPVSAVGSPVPSADAIPALSASPIARALAEFAGTFFICFAIYAVSTYGTVLYGINILLIAAVIGVAYAAATAAFSRFSGAHFNPAITLAAALTSRISWLDALLYLVAQVLGGIAAGAVIIAILPTTETVAAKAWLTYTINGFDTTSLSYLSNSTLQQAGLSFGSTMAIVVEVAMSLLVVAAAIVTMREDGTPSTNRTTAVGLAYGVAAAVTYPITGAGLNPVRSTGIALFAQGKGLTVEPLSQLWLFWICPLLAGAVVALVMLLSSTFSEMLAKNAMAKTAAAGLDSVENVDDAPADDQSEEAVAAVDASEAADASDSTSATSESADSAESSANESAK
ncbi:MIP/aquaporin family protein [Bifidobacterium callimiconis]|uniref:Glycerol transporter n=1 Tax=Bifidobacterium callimiconis TaxID=2306973 RepID=A0A430FHP1_9BIFI|nr:aquaporin [Bifidobacterium callimiconis]MBT1177951.1 aquaporin [Bifidobacterium callimiconis]RSX52311.1 glycerol transporter [Bifidobacterium callimiconis]